MFFHLLEYVSFHLDRIGTTIIGYYCIILLLMALATLNIAMINDCK